MDSTPVRRLPGPTSQSLKTAAKWKAARIRAATPPVAPTQPRCLAGTALSKLLARFGINADEKGCKCKSRAARMDAAGCEWCEAHLDEIVGWLREEATKRKLPFIDAAGRMLVRRAIANARRAASG